MSHTAPSVPLPAAGASTPAAGLGFALVLALIVWLQFGPLIGLVGYRLLPHHYWTLVGALRDATSLLLMGLALLCLLQGGGARWPASVRWAVAMGLAFALAGLLSAAHPMAVLYNLRRMVLMPVLFVSLWVMPWSTLQVQRLFAWILGSSVVVAALGVLAWFAPVQIFDQALDITAYNAAMGFDRWQGAPFEQGGRYFSGDLRHLGFDGVPRAIGSYLEPTTLAAGLAAALAMALARRARGHASTPVLLLIGLCGVLTFSKAFWLFLALLAVWRLLGWPGPQHMGSLVLLLLLGAGGLAASAVHIDWGGMAHLEGFVDGLRYLGSGHWLGEGLGEAGNYTSSGFEAGGDSGIGNAVTQVGVLGLLPLLWITVIVGDVLRQSRRSGDPGGPWLASWGGFWLTTYLFSASSQGVGGNALGFMLLALYLHPAVHAGARCGAGSPAGPGAGP